MTSYLRLLAGLVTGGCAMMAGVVIGPAQSQQVTNQSYQTDVTIELLPVAQLDIIGSNLLYLETPPAGSTIPSSGVKFVVTGNANVILTAEPDGFLQVGTQHLGKAMKDGEAIGYNLELRFPSIGVVGSPRQIAGLPGYAPGPTLPLTADLMATGMQREGEVHMEVDPNWTPHGGIPLPGTYVGQVVLTLMVNG